MIQEIAVGQLVRSVAGRDKGKLYLIYDMLDEAFVRVIDGEKKNLKNPKKKNIKHLECLPARAEVVADKISRKTDISDDEIREAIKILGLCHKEL